MFAVRTIICSCTTSNHPQCVEMCRQKSAIQPKYALFLESIMKSTENSARKKYFPLNLNQIIFHLIFSTQFYGSFVNQTKHIILLKHKVSSLAIVDNRLLFISSKHNVRHASTFMIWKAFRIRIFYVEFGQSTHGLFQRNITIEIEMNEYWSP